MQVFFKYLASHSMTATCSPISLGAIQNRPINFFRFFIFSEMKYPFAVSQKLIHLNQMAWFTAKLGCNLVGVMKVSACSAFLVHFTDVLLSAIFIAFSAFF